ncbi:carbohydrate-binding module family 18 protein [Melanomma pulvis-pyrius CBS 109.77]|uniref:chitinase n=1 Tax=Melanomma pulvis-pyrius CBS 109.77 TaxID=1314802 RepID=A0A6A6X8X1_9PLEO|nr:carbohydrate-binding module family 18 protein [Melanomma pulvis-pyrius CBS 109.77]
MRFPSLALLASCLLAGEAHARFVIYADEWHPTRPTNAADRTGIDHVVLAFAMANNTAAFQPKVPISTIRSEFPDAKVMIAIGGWGDTVGFSEATKTDAGIAKFASDVQTMLTNTGADGIDIDWEYPGGNGADYKQVPNSAKVHEIKGFPKLLGAVRTAIGKDKLLSIAVPGKKGDMIAFTAETAPDIWAAVDYINIMSYDLMNRRDTKTAHHTSVVGATTALENYLDIGAPVDKINLGFAFYAKYFTTAGDCSASPLGCSIVAAEDPITGKDTLTSGAWTYEPAHMVPVDTSQLKPSYDGTCGPEKMTKCTTGCCSQYGNCGTTKEHCSGACQHAFGTGCVDADVAGSWQIAMANSVTDEAQGGQYFYDKQNGLFWTWDTTALITRKFQQIVRSYGIGGVMAWSLGEDSFDWSHIHQIANELGSSGYGTKQPHGKQSYAVVLNDGSEEPTEPTLTDPTSTDPTSTDTTEDDGYYWVDMPENTDTWSEPTEGDDYWYKWE